jgi:hypothetical protein
MIISFDRSRAETWETCPRKRFWLYEYQDKGLEKSDDLKIDARIGTWVHNGIECWMGAIPSSRDAKAAASWAGEAFLIECQQIVVDPPAQLVHDINEGRDIVTALAYAWLRLKAPRLLADGEVLGIEKELTVDFQVPTIGGAEIVRLMARPDIIWRRNADGTIFIRNLKTVRQADDRWREKWALDMQTLSEPLAVDEWMKQQTGTLEGNIHYLGATCGGVIIDGLVTGKITSAKSQFGGLYHHNNHLVYAFRREEPNGAYIYIPQYKYGLQKVAVADSYSGGIIAWVDHLIANHPEVVEEYLIELPPIIRSEYQIERWKRQVLPRETDIRRWAKMVDASPIPDYHLDTYFPMHTAGGNCLYPGKCAAYNLCHGSAAADPLNSGYKLRVPNHPQEKENSCE